MKCSATNCVVNAVLALALLTVVPALWLYPLPSWAINAPKLAFIGVFGLAYIAAAAAMYRRTGGHPALLGRVLMTGLATVGVAFIALVMLRWGMPEDSPFAYSRRALASALIGGLGLLVLTLWFPAQRFATTLALACGLAVAIGLHVAVGARSQPATAAPERAESFTNSSLYPLAVTRYTGWLKESVAHGGGLAVLGERLLVADGDGNLYLVNEAQSRDRLDVDTLSYKVPLNSDEFAAGSRLVFSDAVNDEVEVADFRVAALLTRERGSSVQIFASHHYWHADEQCYVLRVSLLEGSLDEISARDGGLAWRTIFDTKPCLPLDQEGIRGPRFEGYENGGRMAFLSENEMLLTVGDQGFDGVNRSEIHAQDPETSYGKTIAINLGTGAERLFTMGHRNPQGLYLTPGGGPIWLTEHGPRGGDELNLLVEGNNYGWPLVTYGTDYVTHDWPLNPEQGRHNEHTRPILAFLPSIATSSVIGSDSPLFPAWRGDLLIASLKALTLVRVRVSEDRVVIAEPIVIGTKIRDLLTQHDGRLVLLSPFGELSFVEPANAMAGESLITACTGCHGTAESDRATLGPNLWGVVDRPVAADSDFGYSPALKEAGGRWTADRLDRFLESPQSVVPGTSMVFPGIADAEQRQGLIDYLATLNFDE